MMLRMFIASRVVRWAGSKLLAVVPAALCMCGSLVLAQYTPAPQTLPPPPSVQASTTTSGPLQLTDVVAMTQSGLSDEIIARAVSERGVGRALSAQDLIYLKQSGVSTYVIDAVQRSAYKPTAAQVVTPAPTVAPAPVTVAPTIVEPAPVIVRPYYYPYPYYYPRTHIHVGHGHWGHHHHHHHGGGSRVSFGIRF